MRGIFFWIIFTELAKCKVFRYTNKVDFYRGVDPVKFRQTESRDLSRRSLFHAILSRDERSEFYATRGREEVSRGSHKPQTPVQFRAPQHRKLKMKKSKCKILVSRTCFANSR